jgi:hypothetical protein
MKKPMPLAAILASSTSVTRAPPEGGLRYATVSYSPQPNVTGDNRTQCPKVLLNSLASRPMWGLGLG